MRRPHYTRFATFEDPTPDKPMKEAIEKLHSKVKDAEKYKRLKEVVFVKCHYNGLLYHFRFNLISLHLKIFQSCSSFILPLIRTLK